MDDQGLTRIQALVQLDSDRKAAHEEVVRQALTSGPFPVAEHIFEEVANMFVTDAEEVLRCHAGFALHDKVRSLQTTLALFERAAVDLTEALDRFDAFSKRLEFHHRATSDHLDAMETSVGKEIFAFSGLAHSLQDHCRRVREEWEPMDFLEKRRHYFGVEGLHDFVCGLRNALHHRSMVEACLSG